MSDHEKYHATAWGVIDDGLFDITLPSGQVCQARKLEMEDVIRLNIVNELDTFSGMFEDETKEEKKPEEAPSELDVIKKMSNSGGMDRLIKTLNTITIDRVVQPKVLPVPFKPGTSEPIPHAEREPGVYVDVIKFVDKMTIFGKVFDGLGDMADFREESETGVGDLEAQPVVETAAVSTPGVV